jgi:hypothetical protein
MEAAVYDWNRLGRNTLVGTARVPPDGLARALAGPGPGQAFEGMPLLDKAGKPVVGQNKTGTVLTLRVRLRDSAGPGRAGVRPLRSLRVTVVSAGGLPKTDTFGRCDPMAEVR